MNYKLELRVLINKLRNKFNLINQDEVIYEDDDGLYVQ